MYHDSIFLMTELSFKTQMSPESIAYVTPFNNTWSHYVRISFRYVIVHTVIYDYFCDISADNGKVMIHL